MSVIKKRNKYSQNGQALLIVLLAISVVLTVVLSSASRSVTEIKTTTYEEESLRAFSAAEAGVEEKLLNPVIGGPTEVKPDPSDESVSYTTSVTQYSKLSGNNQLSYPKRLSSGETATFLVSSRKENGEFVCGGSSPCWRGNKIRICYGAEGSNPRPAIEVLIYYDETGPMNSFNDLKVYRRLFDEVSNRTSGAEGLGPGMAGCEFGGIRYLRRAEIDESEFNCMSVLGCILVIKVRILYALDQPVGIFGTGSAGSSFPYQGILISSKGKAGETIRNLEVYSGYPEPFDVFENAVFSQNGLSK